MFKSKNQNSSHLRVCSEKKAHENPIGLIHICQFFLFFFLKNVMDHQDPNVMASGAKIQQKICWRYCTEPESILNPESTTDNGLNLIALGRTGDGKSSLLNDFMGAQVFKQKISAKVRKREVNKKKKKKYIIKEN